MSKKGQEEKQPSEQEIKEFLRTYELKKLTYKQIFQIYKKNIFHPCFTNTQYSSIFLIFAPAITNIYYMLKPHSPLSKVIPFTVPVIAFSQYVYVFNKDLQKYCFSEEEDSKALREKYMLLSFYSSENEELKEVVEKIKEFEEEKKT